MLLKTITDLVDQAERIYRDPAFTALRGKHDDREALIANEWPVYIPENMTNRVRVVHQGAAMEKASRGIALITDPLGVRIEVAKVGKSQHAEELRERVRAWLLSLFRDLERRGAHEGTLDGHIKWGVIVHSLCAVRVQPYAAAWAPLTKGKPAKKALDLAGADTADAIMERVNEFLEEAAGIEDDEDERVARITRSILPIEITYLSDNQIRWKDDQFSRRLGPKEVWEFREVTVEEVLSNYLDESGKPLAEEMAKAVDLKTLSPEDVCTLVIRSDRTHMQVFTSGLVLDRLTGDQRTFVSHGQDELLWEGVHGLTRTPYAIFTGRVKPARELVHRYQGLLDPAFETLVELDQLATQISSIRNFVAWPQLYVKKGKDAVGTGDKVADLPIAEATIIDGLGKDEQLETVPWSTREGLDYLQRDYEMKMSAADRLTFGGAAYGSGATDSGYEQQLKETATTATMESFRIGTERGYEDLFQLVLETGRALHTKGLPAIPVRSCLPEGKEWEELAPEMTEYDWDITVSIQQQNPAGKMAHLNALSFAEDRGYITHEEAIRESGNPYPLQVMQQRAIEQHVNSPAMQQFIDGLIQQNLSAALAQRQASGMPTQPLLPPALAGVLAPMAGDPSLGALGARLPYGQPGISNMALPPAPALAGIPGSPNIPSSLPPLGPPTPRMATVQQGGGFPGEGQASPGGYRQDILNQVMR